MLHTSVDARSRSIELSPGNFAALVKQAVATVQRGASSDVCWKPHGARRLVDLFSTDYLARVAVPGSTSHTWR